MHNEETTTIIEMTMTNDKTEVSEASRAALKHKQQPTLPAPQAKTPGRNLAIW
jgi:hypothetical protein